MHRLFLALRPPEPVMQACFDAMEDGPPGWAWQDEDQLHVTLRFIGEVDRRQGDDIVDALSALALKPQSVGLSGVGWFDHGPRGALFARVTPKGPLEALHDKLDRMLVRLGHQPERRAFLPHITLARRRSRAEPPDIWLRARAGLSVPEVPVPSLTLYESRLGRAGASYEPLVEVPLGG